MNILVTGGAGYIGSIVARKLVEAGNRVIILDNLVNGHREAVCPGGTFIKADLGDSGELSSVFQNNKIDSVVHLASLSLVSESMIHPGDYFYNNLSGGINLLNSMVRSGVTNFVFSSSAAVYGNPTISPIAEICPAVPVNPYGETKLIFEKMLRWYGECHGLRFVSLRYFNAAGADNLYGEHHDPETHLIPNVLKVAIGQVEAMKVFGRDYPTPDGTCVRDYIHVSDIAEAHIMALDRLKENAVNRCYNLGNGDGYSILEVIETARRVCGAAIPTVNHNRRQGDPPVLVASAELAKAELGWQPQKSSLEEIIESAWKWQKDHPHGY